MANLRAGITPYSKDGGAKKSATRLASSQVHVWANTWTRRVDVDLSKDGRLSVRVKDGNRIVMDVEIPCNEGDSVNAFEPTVRAAPGFKFEAFGVSP